MTNISKRSSGKLKTVSGVKLKLQFIVFRLSKHLLGRCCKSDTNGRNMDIETIEQIDARVYDMTETHTDDISLIKEYAILESKLKVFEPFCGTGRIGMPLIRDGHEYSGMDISAEMLQLFRCKIADDDTPGMTCELIEGDVLCEEWPADSELVILGGNCFYTLSSAEDQRLCVIKAFECLSPGGIVYVDNDHMEGPLAGAWQDTKHVRRQSVADIDNSGSKLVSFREIVEFDLKEKTTTFRDTLLRVTTDGSTFGKQYVWKKHPVSKREVEIWIEEAGFEIANTFGNHFGNPYTVDSQKAIFVARKPR
jgi:hypothetical protein